MNSTIPSFKTPQILVSANKILYKIMNNQTNNNIQDNLKMD